MPLSDKVKYDRALRMQCYGSDIHNPLYILRIMDVFWPIK